MRGVNRVIFCGRAIKIDSTTISAIASGTTHHRLPQLAPYGTCFSANPQWLSHKLIDRLEISSPIIARSIAGSCTALPLPPLSINSSIQRGCPAQRGSSPKTSCSISMRLAHSATRLKLASVPPLKIASFLSLHW
ncbi:hypothetical protein L6164_024882 [Bauhinia variegata]|uniref:Uncharacterized protein n=1 Tax=Bauhinia variegata TaxID=167791 RepID=A0ACB9M050_BAUVA|nr:hypothetical protein L6164_024882 [Bauhinia variegata]